MSREDSLNFLSSDRTASFDAEKTQPVSMQLIARLAAQDPTVQLKIGMIMPEAVETIEREEKAGR